MSLTAKWRCAWPVKTSSLIRGVWPTCCCVDFQVSMLGSCCCWDPEWYCYLTRYHPSRQTASFGSSVLETQGYWLQQSAHVTCCHWVSGFGYKKWSSCPPRFPLAVFCWSSKQWCQESHELQGLIYWGRPPKTHAWCCQGGLGCLQRNVKMLRSQQTYPRWCLPVKAVGQMCASPLLTRQGLFVVTAQQALWIFGPVLIWFWSQRSLWFLRIKLVAK